MNKRERIQLAMKGENIEEIVAHDEPDVLVTLIDNGYAKEYYEQWKTHAHGTIRYALALQGYYPETFIHDKNPKVREAVVEVDPEYVEYPSTFSSIEFAICDLSIVFYHFICSKPPTFIWWSKFEQRFRPRFLISMISLFLQNCK